jgi:hypothetical protein
MTTKPFTVFDLPESTRRKKHNLSGNAPKSIYPTQSLASASRLSATRSTNTVARLVRLWSMAWTQISNKSKLVSLGTTKSMRESSLLQIEQLMPQRKRRHVQNVSDCGVRANKCHRGNGDMAARTNPPPQVLRLAVLVAQKRYVPANVAGNTALPPTERKSISRATTNSALSVLSRDEYTLILANRSYAATRV